MAFKCKLTATPLTFLTYPLTHASLSLMASTQLPEAKYQEICRSIMLKLELNNPLINGGVGYCVEVEEMENLARRPRGWGWRMS
jgi:hypothetical protein